ncbi:cytosolic endo-beta-N-acetylglucosaminidase isoform X5 [Phyllopteryx taeniolatus]|uniref:cytosolic endo-beta-N-acetylglucosaminidase isoform X5 n=1 Tax=Phyllopteryx taeniolatus TaxID=161469 RepID=UPI002AD217B7|nr:cytosolic endo-beta-N-acetylglucosaminidase isoform X5 [Phyllopteryx taeniolatus]
MECCLHQPVDSHNVNEVINYLPSPLPVKHYDADTTEPISCSLQTLDELFSWKQTEAYPFNVAVVPLAAREPALSSCLQRTLVSHDMMGGYLDDRFVQGTAAEAPYAFYHWQHIDIFNYFTHNLVSIPPAVWTNAAHKHGVLVLGTFITEWSDGEATCEAFLREEELYCEVADKLVEMSRHYGFDGWLINIENTLSEVAVQKTPLFLRYLTNQMHERVPGSMVLWYDSVIENGELKWQNELNQSNRFWALLKGNLSIHRPAVTLPFVSSFCQGFGNAVYCKGKCETKRNWFNLSAQEIQPWYYHEQLDGHGWVRSRACPEDAWNGGCSLLLDGLIPATRTSAVCAKLFSLHVPLSNTLVSIVYKSSSEVTVSLELKITDAALRTDEQNRDVKLISVSPVLLHEEHELIRQFPHLHENKNTGWNIRYSKLDLQGCILREVCVNIQLIGEPCDTTFSCRMGEIMFLDIASLHEAPEMVQDFCISDIVWLRGAGASPHSTSCCLYLNATLQWGYPTELVRHFKVYWRQLKGPNPGMSAGEPVVVGRAYSKLYRITELAVLEPPGQLELLVEPVTWKGFQLPMSYWGRRSVSYSEID